MKKTIITMTIVLGLGMAAFADGDNNNGGLFKRGAESCDNATSSRTGAESLMLPGSHGQDTDQNSPLGSGVAVLVGLGAAYLVGKRRKE